MRFDVMPARWRTPTPHPTHRIEDYHTPAHQTVKVFYDGLPLVNLESVLLFVAEHRDQGWRARKVGGVWRAVQP